MAKVVKRRPKRTYTETDLGGSYPFRLDHRPDPRPQSWVLIGISAIWTGPPKPGRCEFCRGAELRPREYCLGCDRAGRGVQTAKPTRAELAMLRPSGPQGEPEPSGDGSDVAKAGTSKAAGLRGGMDGLRRKGA